MPRPSPPLPPRSGSGRRQRVAAGAGQEPPSPTRGGGAGSSRVAEGRKSRRRPLPWVSVGIPARWSRVRHRRRHQPSWSASTLRCCVGSALAGVAKGAGACVRMAREELAFGTFSLLGVSLTRLKTFSRRGRNSAEGEEGSIVRGAALFLNEGLQFRASPVALPGFCCRFKETVLPQQ